MKCTNPKGIEVQGHRGCRGLMPENTLQAFEKAIDLGVQTLELDVVISKDKKVIVSHEPYLSRTICLDAEGNTIPKKKDKAYNLYQMTYEEIKAFDCGMKFHKRYPNQKKISAFKPSLEDVFLRTKHLSNHIKFNIEIKAKPKYDDVFTPHPKEFVRLVLETINTYDVFSRCNLQSFDLRILEQVKQQAPQMKVAILIDEDESISEKVKKLSYKPEIISPYYKLLDQTTVLQYQKADCEVIPWTVNSASEMSDMINFKVDAIITDYPDVLLDILKGKQAALST
ncbi:glycerophosphodiester phosphodiesterase family protein [Lacinutrix iliipiscaria]|uniref:Glycerophosphodiester phosphodiesterase family protein n=1 Tax=Lacinutrix iliipiscaria TaxID=1230532 RepID=A0ABW5WPD2_9FLAO